MKRDLPSPVKNALKQIMFQHESIDPLARLRLEPCVLTGILSVAVEFEIWPSHVCLLFI